MKRYIHIWWILSIRSLQTALVSRFGSGIFMLGKLLRFFSFLAFLLLLVGKTNTIAGYGVWDIILLYATFNFIDTTTQFLLREVYRFRQYVVTGQLDYIFIKPFSPLFRSLFGGSDPLDIPLLIISIIFIWVAFTHIHVGSLVNVIAYWILIVNALIIALSFHIMVLGLGILTTEVDNSIMFFRDLTQMGRFPIEIYQEPLRAFLTFIIPIGIMMTFPIQVLLGVLSWQMIVISIAIGGIFLILSLLFWNYASRYYASASS